MARCTLSNYLKFSQKMFSELPQFRHVWLDEDAAVEQPAPGIQSPPVNSQRADQPHCLRPAIYGNVNRHQKRHYTFAHLRLE